MTITEYEYAATTVRALMVAEAAMASVNCGAAIVTRARWNCSLVYWLPRSE